MSQHSAGVIPCSTVFSSGCAGGRGKEEGGTCGKKEKEPQGPLRVRCQVHSDRETSDKTGRLKKKKKSVYLDQALFKPGALLSISRGGARAAGATATHMLGLDTQPWIVYQISRRENPPAHSNSSAGCRASLNPP